MCHHISNAFDYVWLCLEGLRKTIKSWTRIVNLAIEIRTASCRKTRQKYHCSHQLAVYLSVFIYDLSKKYLSWWGWLSISVKTKAFSAACWLLVRQPVKRDAGLLPIWGGWAWNLYPHLVKFICLETPAAERKWPENGPMCRRRRICSIQHFDMDSKWSALASPRIWCVLKLVQAKYCMIYRKYLAPDAV